jgi:hypothetical protein
LWVLFTIFGGLAGQYRTDQHRTQATPFASGQPRTVRGRAPNAVTARSRTQQSSPHRPERSAWLETRGAPRVPARHTQRPFLTASVGAGVQGNPAPTRASSDRAPLPVSEPSDTSGTAEQSGGGLFSP